jgi:hypothetical protein
MVSHPCCTPYGTLTWSSSRWLAILDVRKGLAQPLLDDIRGVAHCLGARVRPQLSAAITFVACRCVGCSRELPHAHGRLLWGPLPRLKRTLPRMEERADLQAASHA